MTIFYNDYNIKSSTKALVAAYTFVLLALGTLTDTYPHTRLLL